MTTRIELRRRNGSGDLVDWAVNDDGTEPVADAVARSTLGAISARLDAPLDANVAGTVSVDNLPLDPATETTLKAVEAILGGTIDVSGAVVATGPLTDTQLRAAPIDVVGPLTDVELRASPVAVSGTITAMGPLTDAQLRAAAVSVSGTVTAVGPLTDVQLRAADVGVADDLTEAEPLEDQAGDGGVLSFTFAAPVHLVFVESTGADLVARATPTGTPSATKGWRCSDGVPVAIPCVTTEVKVFAPVGTTITVNGLRR